MIPPAPSGKASPATPARALAPRAGVRASWGGTGGSCTAEGPNGGGMRSVAGRAGVECEPAARSRVFVASAPAAILSARRRLGASSAAGCSARLSAPRGMAPKGELGPPPQEWQAATAGRLDAYQEKVNALRAAIEGTAASSSSQAAASGAAEPAAAAPPPSRRRRGGCAHGWGVPLPTALPADADEERHSLRLSRTSPANFSPFRRAVMVGGRPVVVPCQRRGGRSLGGDRLGGEGVAAARRPGADRDFR